MADGAGEPAVGAAAAEAIPLLETSDARTPPTPRKHPAQPHFTTLTLPEEYSHLSLLTRLWLQSRIFAAPTTGKASSSKSSGRSTRAASPADAEDAPPKDETPFRPPGSKRPFNLRMIWVWLDIVRALALGPYLATSVRYAHPLRLAVYVLKLVADKLYTPAKLYCTAQLYDLAEKALAHKPAPWRTALRVASMSFAISIFDEVTSILFDSNNDALQKWIDWTFERTHLALAMDAPIHATTETSAALMYEASVFCQMEHADSYSDGPWGLINGLGGAFADSLLIMTQVTMLLNAVGGVSQLRSGNKQRFSALTLLAFAFAPTFLTRLRNRFFGFAARDKAMQKRADKYDDAERDRYTFQELATHPEYKQETVLFGLRNWVLGRWDKAVQQMAANEEEQSPQKKAQRLVFLLGNEIVSKAFYVLLATRTIDTGLSLGSIHVYQSTADSLVWSFRGLGSKLNSAYQSMFYAAAFVGALEPVARGREIDYDTTRVPGGMRIEAKNLSFTYPGTDETVLRDINLSIAPGETIAIVGYNGGGKSTLVKILMGLYEATAGELEINGVPVHDLDHSTLHIRTSALFQDFVRYPLSLQDNVGVGNIPKHDDAEAIVAAIEAGGAQAVLDKAGLNGQLEPYGEPAQGNKAYKSWRDDMYDFGSDSDDSDGESDDGSSVVKVAEKGDAKGEDKVDDSGNLGASGDDDEAEQSGATTPKTPTTPAGKPKKKQQRDVQLSGGQWQRVGLARAFMRAGQADLVVFDEPSAALDPKAETELFANIHGLSRAAGATTIYISHRFNTVRRADRIVLIADGTIVEAGTHAQLMAQRGQYRDLFMMQAEGYVGADVDAVVGVADAAGAGEKRDEVEEAEENDDKDDDDDDDKD